MDLAGALARLERLPSVQGGTRCLDVGPWCIRLLGLDPPLARALDRRWGPFVSVRDVAATHTEVTVVDCGAEAWLEHWSPGDRYRLEGGLVGGRPVVLSYHFAAAEVQPGHWHASVSHGSEEPEERLMDNVARVLVARLASDAGGIALHGAGVLRRGKAWIFAGPSRAGKSTAVAHSPDSESLGDDFAVAIPAGAGWSAVAVPFDNAEIVPEKAPVGTYPLAGVWRLHQSVENRSERLAPAVAAASLVACAAFPWAIPDRAELTTAASARLASEGLFGHLHFRRSSEFWSLLE